MRLNPEFEKDAALRDQGELNMVNKYPITLPRSEVKEAI